MEMMNYVVSLLSLTILMNFVFLGVCETYKPLQWSPLNPLFQTNGNTSAYRINVHLYSRFNIICPNPANNPVTISENLRKENMYENIWHVDKKSFETCTVNSTVGTNSKVFECSDPLHLKYYPMIILPTTNIMGQPEFELGVDHYFIATSNGSQNSLKNKALGHCHTKNMRFIIYVCKNVDDPLCNTKKLGPPGAKSGEEITINETTTQPPTDRKSKDPVAAGRKEDCFIAADERIWLILVCVLGALVFVLLLSHVCLCYRRRARKSRKSRTDEKRTDLIL